RVGCGGGDGGRQPGSSSGCSPGSGRCRRDPGVRSFGHAGAPHRTGHADAGVAATENHHVEFLVRHEPDLIRCTATAAAYRHLRGVIVSRYLVVIVEVIELTTWLPS